METKPKIVMERVGNIKDHDRSFDVEFWQKCGTNSIFSTAWEMVITAYKLKGWNTDELKFYRSVEGVRKKPG